MAQRTITIAGLGPFIYDDSTQKAIRTDGEIDAGQVNLVRALQKSSGIDVAQLENDLDVENLIVTLDFG